MENYLSESEQYKEELNNEEIGRIKDPELRKIRERHWKYRHDIFCDEARISDKQLQELFDIDIQNGKEELKEYRKKINKRVDRT